MHLLVHSPLVGPSTWRPVADELGRRGRRARVADLGAVGAWRDVARAVSRGVPAGEEPVLLAGHSGAGPLLPAIADALEAPVAGLVFVDALLPPPRGAAALAPEGARDQLRALARDGVLPPWSQWFGEEAMRELVPDDAVRAALEREMPRLPLSYFDGRPPVRSGWDRERCAYLLLSEAYDAAAADARERGWPVAELPGAGHLGIVTEPAAVASALLELEGRLAG